MSRPLLAVVLALAACTRPDTPASIVASVDSATRAFESAQRARDADRIVAHLAPEFFMYADGQRMDYATVVGNIRNDFGSIRHVEPGFANIEVLPQGPDAAVASFTFRDSIVMGDGALRRFTGATTLAWRRRGSDWLIVHAAASHRPVEPPVMEALPRQ